MSVTLESSLNSLKLALAQMGSAGAAGQASTVLATSAVTGAVATPNTASGSSISLTRSAVQQLDL